MSESLEYIVSERTFRPLLDQHIKAAAAAAKIGGGSGSDARSVSGTVAFTPEDQALPPFVVATTTGATVEGVSLAAGQMAAFWYLNGVWHVMVHGQDATWRSTAKPDTRTPVTPNTPTFTNNLASGGGTWTTTPQTGVAFSPASGTAQPGQTITVTATLTDPATYKFSTGAKTTWTHTFLDLSTPATDTFTGPAGTTLAGRTTQGLPLTWEADGATAQLALTGTNSASAPVAATTSANVLRPQKITTEVSFKFANLGTRLDVGFFNGTALVFAAAVLHSTKIAVFANNAVAVETLDNVPRTSGKVRFSYDGSTVSLWVDDTLVGTKAVSGLALQPFKVQSRLVTGSGPATTISDLSIRYL